jgi:predicted dehydrogenase
VLTPLPCGSAGGAARPIPAPRPRARWRRRVAGQLRGWTHAFYLADCHLNNVDLLLNDFRARFPKVSCTESLAEALKDPAVDAVIVATPASTHFAVGKQVFCENLLMEKPLTVDPAEADELVRLAREAGVRLMTGFTFLFVPAVTRARELMRSPEFGRYYLTSCRSNLGPVWG